MWEGYRRAPSHFAFRDLMGSVPRDERAAWHAKAVMALEGAGLSSRIELHLATKERARLADAVAASQRARLVALSHCTTEPAARTLTRSHPVLAAKLHVAMALRMLKGRKSSYYDAALGSLGKARKLPLREGRVAEWRLSARSARRTGGRPPSCPASSGWPRGGRCESRPFASARGGAGSGDLEPVQGRGGARSHLIFVLFSPIVALPGSRRERSARGHRAPSAHTSDLRGINLRGIHRPPRVRGPRRDQRRGTRAEAVRGVVACSRFAAGLRVGARRGR